MTLKKSDQLSALDLCVLPAIFARSNCGQGLPDRKTVERYLDPSRRFTPTLQGCVVGFCEQFMECDDHEEMFLEEARGWVKSLKKDGKSEICWLHPDIAALYWGAEDPVVIAGRKKNEELAKKRRAERKS